MEGNTKWQAGYLPKVGKLERCLLGTKEIQVPEAFLEQVVIIDICTSYTQYKQI